ncbi:MAG TPA: protease htpX-like protein [Pyrodictium sp.]|nr:protease htpX-like protein [Pyrodictium sp.]
MYLFPLYFALWPSWLLVALASLVTVVAIAFIGPRLITSNPKSLVQLKISMMFTALAVVGISTLLLWFTINMLGYSGNLLLIAILVAVIGFVQWLIAPYIINMLYAVRDAGPELSWLREEVYRIAEASGLSKKPKLVIAEVDAPNAFAYGNPFTGYYVAITRGMLKLMSREEIIAVVGHEIGHLRHKDVHILLALGLLPSIVYYVGRILVDLSIIGGYYNDRRGERGGALTYLAVGIVLVVVSIILHFLLRHLSRLREYYADAHSAIVIGSSKPLQRALAKLHLAYTNNPKLIEELRKNSATSMLFFVNYFYDIDSVVEELKRAETNPLLELFSTHPPIPKRLRFLDELERSLLKTA